MNDSEFNKYVYEMYKDGVKYGWESACYKIMDYINDCQATGAKETKVISDIVWFCLTNLYKTPLTSDKIGV